MTGARQPSWVLDNPQTAGWATPDAHTPRFYPAPEPGAQVRLDLARLLRAVTGPAGPLHPASRNFAAAQRARALTEAGTVTLAARVLTLDGARDALTPDGEPIRVLVSADTLTLDCELTQGPLRVHITDTDTAPVTVARYRPDPA